METYITNTVELYSTNGVVHIKAVGFDPEEGYTYIEWDARALLNDLPAFYRMAQQAIKQEDQYQTKKFVEFKKQLAQDFKGKRGRPKE